MATLTKERCTCSSSPRGGWATATETAKLTASDGAPNDGLGGPYEAQSTDVGISGDTVVAGAVGATVNGNAGQGAVYVFVKPWSGWRNETQTAKLTASDGAAHDALGGDAAISGDTVVASAWLAKVNGNPEQGAVYVFVKPWSGWRNETQTAKLTASDGTAYEQLGWSAAIDGDTVATGAPCATIDGNSCQGAVYVFVRPWGGWRNETEAAKLTASDGAPNDNLGLSVAILGDTIVAGTYYATVNGNPFQGAAYVYVFVRPWGGWANATETAKLTASDGAAYDYFGWSVGVSPGTITVGSVSAGPVTQGAVYVFEGRDDGLQTAAENALLARATRLSAVRRSPAVYALRRRSVSAYTSGGIGAVTQSPRVPASRSAGARFDQRKSSP